LQGLSQKLIKFPQQCRDNDVGILQKQAW